MSTIEKYLHEFVTLRTATVGGKQAPHKAVLLLAIMELVADGIIKDNHIVLSEELVNRFEHIWKQYIKEDAPFQQKVAPPYWHLKNEPFYHLYFNDGTEANEIDNPYSIKKLREIVYASFDHELYELIKTDSGREELSAILFVNYLGETDFSQSTLSKKTNLIDVSEHLMEKVKARDDESINKMLIECSGRSISQYRLAIKDIVKSKLTKEEFWWFLKVVLKANPTMFKLPIIEALYDIKTIDPIIVPNINCEIANVIELLFKDSDKVLQDIDLLYLFRDFYNEKMPDVVKQMSYSIRQPETFFKLFEIYHIYGKNKVDYLLNVCNEASLFAVCQLFADKCLQKKMSEDELNIFKSVEYKKSSYNVIQDNYDFERLSKRIILSTILPLSKTEKEIIDRIIDEGYLKFHSYLCKGQAKKQRIETVKDMNSDIGESYTALLLGESVNHYIVCIKAKIFLGLLPKKFADLTEFKEKATITVKVIGVDKKKQLYFVAQKECNMNDIMSIPLANIGDEVVISYNNEGKVCLVRSGCLKQINPIVLGQKEHFDYKAKYSATIVGRQGFYDYEMQIKLKVGNSINGTCRLSKAAKELNIGIAQLTAYLTMKGYSVKNNPNQKINAVQYQLLIEAFGKKDDQ